MDNNSLNAKIAALESQNDQLEAELTYIHSLLQQFGFPEGVESLKMSLEEILAVDSAV